MKLIITSLFLLCLCSLQAQSSLKGQLQDADGAAVGFSNVALYNQSDSSIAKVEISDESGIFQIKGIPAGSYFLVASFVGLSDLRKEDISLSNAQSLDLGVLTFAPASVELTAATVTASRAMVEVKPDRTVFNVEGTINSVGANAIELLRKAPSVTVDNNDNVSVLGRSGVMLYVDGKRLPLGGEELANYLKSIQADQIDRIDIITSPGAKYEAEGNAGIIDIRLKKNKNFGANGTASLTGSQGRFGKVNSSVNGNFRNKWMNVFATASGSKGKSFHEMIFLSRQKGLLLDEFNEGINSNRDVNLRLGTDFYLADNHILGFLVSGFEGDADYDNYNRIALAKDDGTGILDSVLIADNMTDYRRNNRTYNINYRYDNKKGRSVNLDLDYGKYDALSDRFQPNRYYDAAEQNLLSENIDLFDTETYIDIYTFKLDYEEEVLGGKFGVGSKLSRVVSDNSFLFADQINGSAIQNDTFSNRFEYVENVYAGYLNYARPMGEKWNFSAGLRAEHTDAYGDLRPFLPELQEPRVNLNYISWFPSAGLTYQAAPMHSLSLNYGKRINRPDYNVLNPFNNRLSELSYERGNPRIAPEIVNNVELGWTYQYRYNFKLGYSRTIDQITRLIAPDNEDDRASIITYANLASQTVYSASASLPFQWKDGWSAYFNLSGSRIDNQASYPDGGVVDIQAYTYSIYMQHTIDLPAGFKGEVSGYFSGPGVWGGVFLYSSNWSLNLGLQRKFIQDKLNARLSVNDIFYESGWEGSSNFNGLYSEGRGRWDSRRVSLSLSYSFGNENVKSRKRKTGLESEAERVGQ